jgi:hypothetical protein
VVPYHLICGRRSIVRRRAPIFFSEGSPGQSPGKEDDWIRMAGPQHRRLARRLTAVRMAGLDLARVGRDGRAPVPNPSFARPLQAGCFAFSGETRRQRLTPGRAESNGPFRRESLPDSDNRWRRSYPPAGPSGRPPPAPTVRRSAAGAEVAGGRRTANTASQRPARPGTGRCRPPLNPMRPHRRPDLLPVVRGDRWNGPITETTWSCPIPSAGICLWGGWAQGGRRNRFPL